MPAPGRDSAGSGRKRAGNRTGAEGRLKPSLSVSEALVVRLARDEVAAGSARGGGGGRGGTGGGAGRPRVASCHERESVSVTGLLREVGFRSTSTAFGAGAGGARTGRKVAPREDTGSGSVDMFDVLSRTRMQLCVTLEEALSLIHI